MFTRKQLKAIEKYLTAYQTTSGEFLEDPLDQQELQEIISTVRTKIENSPIGPINLKPCIPGEEEFDYDERYSRWGDTTFIVRVKYKHGDRTKILGEEVCGFYYGEPNHELTEKYINNTFWEGEED